MTRWAAAALGLGLFACAPGTEAPVEKLSRGSIRFPAVVNADGFENDSGLAGYHAIVFKGGRAAGAALFQAEVTDVQVLEALESLGAKPGDALPLDTWEERNDPESDAPDRIIQGPDVEILVALPGGGEPLPLASFLEDPGGRGLGMRFGGHRENIPHWRSGCIACLYSCPGSKVGNDRYTVRDFVAGTTRFRPRRDALPPDGTQVHIILRLS